MVQDVKIRPLREIPGQAYPFFAVFFATCFVYGLWVVWRGIQTRAPHKKNQLRYVFAAALAGLVSFIVFALVTYRWNIPPVHYLIEVGVVLTLAIAIVKHQLMDIELFIKRSLVFAGLSLFVVVTVTVGVLTLPEILGRYVQVNRWLSTLLAGAIVALLYDPLKTFLVNVTDRYLFQKQYDYKDLLRRFSDEVLSVLDLRKLEDMTIRTLAETIRLESCALLLINRATGRYELTSSMGLADRAVPLDAKHPLVQFLQKTQSPFVREQRREKNPALEASDEVLGKLRAEVCVPLVLRDELVGILALGRKKSGDSYTPDDLGILMALAGTEAIAISNALLAAEVAQKEKLAVIGTLAAAINHEVCNPLNNIKVQAEGLLIQLQRGQLSDLSRQELETKVTELMKVTMQEIDRTAAITTRLSNFAKPMREPMSEPVEGEKVVDEVIGLLGHDLELRQIAIEKKLSPDLPKILTDRRQLQEILFNLVRNAGQAIEQKGKITIRAGLNGSERVAIEVSDTGSGIPPEQLQRLFTPFFTTKGEGKGTGLGLFVVKQLVERNGGTIKVQSQTGVGTSFILEFPVAQHGPVHPTAHRG